MPKNILVTGGAGYIGSHTVAELAAAGHNPVIVDNLSNSEAPVVDRLRELTGRDIPFFEIDCANAQALTTAFKGAGPVDGVIHFAASKAVGESVKEPLTYYKNNLGSLITLLEVMGQQDCRSVVFSSSCTVYGQPDHLPVTEETPRQEAESPYGNTKKICEDILMDHVNSGAGVKCVSLRYFNPIGAHSSAMIGELPLGVPENLVPFVTQTAAGLRGQLTVFGNDYQTEDGTCIRDYIHVTDLAKAHIRSLEYLDKQAESDFWDVFNVGTGRGSSVLQIIKTFEEATGVKLNYTIGDRRPGDIEKIYADVTKAREQLKWTAELTLKDALKSAWQWEVSKLRSNLR
jgi:UDP-glucose 4-epimerase